MLCSECGTENADNAGVCEACGALLVPPQDDDLNEDAVSEGSVAQPDDEGNATASEDATEDATENDKGTPEATDATPDAADEPQGDDAGALREDGTDTSGDGDAPSDAALDESRAARERERWESKDNAYERAGSNRKPLVWALLAAVLIAAGVASLSSPATSSTSSAIVVAATDGTATVAFEPGNADGGAMTPIVVQAGSSVTVPKCAFLYRKHDFMGWKDQTGKMWQPGTKLVVEADTTLTATWDNDLCSVTFVSPEGKGDMSERLVVRGARFTAPICTFTWEGHRFWAWVTADGSAYAPGDDVICTGDMTLTASWDHVEEPATAEEESAAAEPVITLSPQTMPRVWRGTYGGYSDLAPNGVILRSLEIDIFECEDSGRIAGTVNVGVADQFEGMAEGSYAFEGTVDWPSGAISLYGTAFTNQGGLQQMGSFAGTIDVTSWTIVGQWIDPAGILTSSAWSMNADLGI